MHQFGTQAARATSWLRTQPDRPFVILFGHVAVVTLYITGNAVSKLPFSDSHTKQLISSDIIPTIHGAAALILLLAISLHRYRGIAAGASLVVWAVTTASLFVASHQRVPPGAYWSFALSTVITVAAFLMLVRWGVDGDDRGVA